MDLNSLVVIETSLLKKAIDNFDEFVNLVNDYVAKRIEIKLNEPVETGIFFKKTKTVLEKEICRLKAFGVYNDNVIHDIAKENIEKNLLQSSRGYVGIRNFDIETRNECYQIVSVGKDSLYACVKTCRFINRWGDGSDHISNARNHLTRLKQDKL